MVIVTGYSVYCFCCVSDTRPTRRASFCACSSQCASMIYCKLTARNSCHCICIYSRCDITSLKGIYMARVDVLKVYFWGSDRGSSMFMSTERVSQCFLQYNVLDTRRDGTRSQWLLILPLPWCWHTAEWMKHIEDQTDSRLLVQTGRALKGFIKH